MTCQRWNNVLDSCEVGHKLSWKLLFTDMLGILRWEVVLEATGCADPSLVSEVNLTEWVQHGGACFAHNGLIVDKRHILNLFKWGVKAAHRHNDTCG